MPWAAALALLAAGRAASAADARAWDCRASCATAQTPCPRYEEVAFERDCDESKYVDEEGFYVCAVAAGVITAFCIVRLVLRNACGLCGGLTINRHSWWRGTPAEKYRECDEKREQQLYARDPRNCADHPRFAKGLVFCGLILSLSALGFSVSGIRKMREGIDAFWWAAGRRLGSRDAELAAVRSTLTSPVSPYTTAGAFAKTADSVQSTEQAYISAEAAYAAAARDLRQQERDSRSDLLTVPSALTTALVVGTTPLFLLIGCCAFFHCGRNGACGCNGRGLSCTVWCLLFPWAVAIWLLTAYMNGVRMFTDDFCTEVAAIDEGGAHGGFVDSYYLRGLCPVPAVASEQLTLTADQIAEKDVCTQMQLLCNAQGSATASRFDCGSYAWSGCSAPPGPKRWPLADRAAGTGAVLPAPSAVLAYTLRSGVTGACSTGLAGCTLQKCAAECTDAGLRGLARAAVAALDNGDRAASAWSALASATNSCSSRQVEVVRDFRPDCARVEGSAVEWLIGCSLVAAASLLLIASAWLGIKRFFRQESQPAEPANVELDSAID